MKSERHQPKRQPIILLTHGSRISSVELHLSCTIGFVCVEMWTRGAPSRAGVKTAVSLSMWCVNFFFEKFNPTLLTSRATNSIHHLFWWIQLFLKMNAEWRQYITLMHVTSTPVFTYTFMRMVLVIRRATRGHPAVFCATLRQLPICLPDIWPASFRCFSNWRRISDTYWQDLLSRKTTRYIYTSLHRQVYSL